MLFLGRLDSKNGVGVNKLIQEGAKITVCVNDILNDFKEFKNKRRRKVIQNCIVKKEYRKIYEILGNNPLSVEEISLKTNNDITCTSKLLTLMEFEDLVKNIVGARLC